jgi:hypothetical protein
VSSGVSRESTDGDRLKNKAPPIEERQQVPSTPVRVAADDEEESEEVSEEEEEEENDDEKKSLRPKAIVGVIPKDIEKSKEIMSFIAYAQHLETACKLISCNKNTSFVDNPTDKNRIYLSGTSIMSTKLTVSMEHCRKICGQLDM